MPILLRSLLLLELCVPCVGAEVLPTAGKSVGLVRDDTPGSWAVVSSTFEAVDVHEIEGTAAEGFKGCYWEAPAGKYLVIKSGGGKLKTFAVTLGGVAPIPPPPGPTPIPPPEPPPPDPTPKGASRIILMFEETKLPHPWSAEDPSVEAWLQANVPGSWNRWDDDYVADSFKKYSPAVASLYMFGKGSRPDDEPTVVVEFKDGQRKSYTMPEKPENLIKLMESFK